MHDHVRLLMQLEQLQQQFPCCDIISREVTSSRAALHEVAHVETGIKPTLFTMLQPLLEDNCFSLPCFSPLMGRWLQGLLCGPFLCHSPSLYLPQSLPACRGFTPDSN